MRRLSAILFSSLALVSIAGAAEGHLYKVLPQFFDAKGRVAQTPSLYDRDAYQAYLRKNPAQISGLRFAVQWKAMKAGTNSLKLRVEMRGTAQGDVPKQTTVETSVEQHWWFSHWASLDLGGKDYQKFGEVTAWRVTLWEDKNLLAEQKSFLW